MNATDTTLAGLLAYLKAIPAASADPLEDHLRGSDRWTWEECLRAVLCVPDADGPRLMAARWLEENAGTVPCGNCEGCGFTHDGAGGNRGPCPDCGGEYEPKEHPYDRGWSPGSGRVGDGRRERAVFVRVQVELARLDAPIDRLIARPGRPPTPRQIRTAASPKLPALRKREGELYDVHIRQWGGLLLRDMGHYISRARWLGEDTGRRVFWQRGFVHALALPAGLWVTYHETLFWHPDQRVPCPECRGRKRFMEMDEDREGTPRPRFHDCPACSGEGTVPRPFVATAQPIREVTLTTVPGRPRVYWEGFGECEEAGDDAFTSSLFPGVLFRLPPHWRHVLGR